VADSEMGGGGVAPALRRALLAADLPSLDWAFWKLTGTWLESGKMISCPLPGHDDSTPSFNLWSDNEEGVPQRYGCFGCGRKGDVVDLIVTIKGIDEDEALTVAHKMSKEEKADETPHKREPSRPRPTRALADEYDRIVSAMRMPEFDMLQQYLHSKNITGQDIEQFVIDDWGWVAARGIIAIPHRSEDGTITGLKYRQGDKKWTEPGSQFTQLYGTWRDGAYKRAVLCEGESDTVWTAYHLRDQPIDVFGLPSGAQQEIRTEWLDRLSERELILAFDGDKAPPQKC